MLKRIGVLYYADMAYMKIDTDKVNPVEVDTTTASDIQTQPIKWLAKLCDSLHNFHYVTRRDM